MSRWISCFRRGWEQNESMYMLLRFER